MFVFFTILPSVLNSSQGQYSKGAGYILVHIIPTLTHLEFAAYDWSYEISIGSVFQHIQHELHTYPVLL